MGFFAVASRIMSGTESTVSDGWGFYFLLVDQKPAVISVDLGLARVAPNRSLPNLAYLRVHMRSPRPDGLSSNEEFDILVALEDKLIQQFTTSDATVYVGRNTSDGKRDFFFYTRAADWRANVLKAIQGFPEYQFETGTREDAKWETYFGFLYPDEMQLQTIKNRSVCDTLQKNGDPLTRPRQIDHWAYFDTALARDTFVSRAANLGFRLANKIEPAAAGNNFGARISQVAIPSFDAIDGITLPLFELAKELGGEYDGWETEVIREQPPTAH